MRLKILTPERVTLDADMIDSVFARSTRGEFGVLKGHIPLVAALDVGLLAYTQGGRRHTAAVMGGVLETDGNTVIVLTSAAELSSEVDTLRARHARERAEARLREKSDNVDLKRAELALSRAIARIKASSSADDLG
ncbi:MAG: ATP synthase F1 subunit epsilon [Vampirovibrionales bacterium]|nr:ATP synthase F1 subunit epsilon [Vampirovibrionales bacterium]